MAVYSGGDGDAEFVSHCRTSRDPSPTWESEGLLDGYPNVSTVNFSSVVSFRAKCKDLLNRVTEGSGCPYLVFTGVSLGSFEIIDGLRKKKNGSLSQMALLYDKVEETHCQVDGRFCACKCKTAVQVDF
jgi:hypothetical protein